MAPIAEFVRQYQRVGFDSNVLIGLFEDRDYSDQAVSFFDSVRNENAELWTSVMTVPEVLIRPTQQRAMQLIRAYEAALFESSLSFADVELTTSRRAVALAERYGLETRDALHLASLLDAGVQAFVTADRDFATVTDLAVLVLSTGRRQPHR